MRIFLAIITLILISKESFSQTLLLLNESQKIYNSGEHRKAIIQLRNLEKKNPFNLEIKRTLTNYYSWEEYSDLSKKEAEMGYVLSENREDFYPYFFYDKKTLNRFFIEGSFTTGVSFDSSGIFFESSHNYEDNDWFILNYNVQNRYSDPSESGEILGLGILTFLSKDSYLQSMIYLSPTRSFLPDYSFENEIYYYFGNNSFSFGLKYSSYQNETSLITISPGFRHDFDKFYAGIKTFHTFTDINLLHSFRFYLGKEFTYRTKGEFGYSSGLQREDGITEVSFKSYDFGLKYKLSHSTEVGLKYQYYNSTSGSLDNSWFLNLLWKY